MKIFTCFLFFALGCPLWAHKSVKVQSLDDAVSKLGGHGAVFRDMSIPGGLRYLRSLKRADGADITTIFQFEVKADWGPIHGLVAIHEGSVTGVEILSFIEHIGNGVTQPAFLNQFKDLQKETLSSASIKPLPKEPLTSLAILEVIDIVLHANDSHQ